MFRRELVQLLYLAVIPEQEMPRLRYTKDMSEALFNSCQTVRDSS